VKLFAGAKVFFAAYQTSKNDVPAPIDNRRSAWYNIANLWGVAMDGQPSNLLSPTVGRRAAAPAGSRQTAAFDARPLADDVSVGGFFDLNRRADASDKKLSR